MQRVAEGLRAAWGPDWRGRADKDLKLRLMERMLGAELTVVWAPRAAPCRLGEAYGRNGAAIKRSGPELLAHPGRDAQPLLATCGVLARREPQLGRDIVTEPQGPPGWLLGFQRRRNQRPHAGDGHQTASDFFFGSAAGNLRLNGPCFSLPLLNDRHQT